MKKKGDSMNAAMKEEMMNHLKEMQLKVEELQGDIMKWKQNFWAGLDDVSISKQTSAFLQPSFKS